MPPDLRDAVVIVTGASSGVGRATVERLTSHGATVVAVARRKAPLDELVRRAEGGEGRAVARPADVTDAAALESIAADTVAAFGRLDAWVNNAGVTQYGHLEEVPLDEWHRVVETNLFGYAHGARAALPHFREQGRGVLVNVASVLSGVPAPLQTAYVASKSAVKGLSDSLRQELRDAPGIAVTTILPGPVDTPLFQHAANRTGYRLQPPPPTLDAVRVAAAIVRTIRRPRPEVPIIASTRLGVLSRRLVPGLTERGAAQAMSASHLTDEPSPPTAGNLHEPVAGGRSVSGGWKPTRTGSPGRLLTTVVGVGAAAAAVAAGVRARQ